MKRSTLALSIASVSLALLTTPVFAQSANPSNDGQPRGSAEALHMVAARATLSAALDAHRTTDGFQFRARLASKVRLDNGQMLPEGTLLVGQVSNDDMNVAGKSRLALRFTQADLRDGKTLPIKATIVGIYNPGDFSSDNDIAEQIPNSWTPGTLKVDEIGVLSGVDLHSCIASRNSGVLVATSKDDVKVPNGSELALAIAPANDSNTTNNGD